MANKKPLTNPKKISVENKQFYTLGYLNGESRLQKQIKEMKKVNNILMDEILRLDREEPRNGVVMGYVEVGRLIKALKQTRIRYDIAVKLQKRLDKARANDNQEVLLALDQMAEMEFEDNPGGSS